MLAVLKLMTQDIITYYDSEVHSRDFNCRNWIEVCGRKILEAMILVTVGWP